MPALIDNYTPATSSVPVRTTYGTYHNYSFEGEAIQVESSMILSVQNVVPTTNKSNLNGRIFRLLDEFTSLKDNWDDDDAKAPSREAIHKARFIVSVLGKHGQKVFHAAPGPNGEVMLDIRNQRTGRSVEIIFYAHKSVAVFFPKSGQPTQTSFDIADLPEVLTWVNAY